MAAEAGSWTGRPQLADRPTDRDHLTFEVLARCNTTRARVSKMTLPHGETYTPTFMPVATQGTMKGLDPSQVAANDVSLILNNTYHLSLRPGTKLLDAAGGAHRFQGWNRNLLSDSGGFQMVSLVKLSTVTEEGVQFENPHKAGELLMLSPEESINIQHSIGTDIMMQLDDVIASTTPDPVRVEEAMYRSVRWLDRCIAHHLNHPHPHRQNLFAIIQGGLSPSFRAECLKLMTEPHRAAHCAGYAVGGLSGGEEKDVFWRIVKQCCDALPDDKPRYGMGIGYAEDLLVIAALGIDMADCVFPTRTARFGVALTRHGPVNLKLPKYANDFGPLDPDCGCATCAFGKGYSRAFLNGVVRRETAAAHAVTIHNLAFQSSLMRGAREAIISQTFPRYLKDFFRDYFGVPAAYPGWCVNALRSVGVDLLEGYQGAEPGSGQGAKGDQD